MRPMLRTSRMDVSARKTYDLLDEPTGDDYDALLECALVQCSTAVLTVRAATLEPAGHALVESLAPYQQAKGISPAGSLVRYALTRESTTLLQGATRGLYGWQHPHLAENLCLYRGDGSPWLVSIAEARIGYLEVSPFEKLLLGRTAPGLIAVLAHQASRDAISAYLERRFEAVVEVLSRQFEEYGSSVLAEGRDGLVDAADDWVRSGDQARVAAALEVIGALRLVELRDEIAGLLRAAIRNDSAVPGVYRSSPALRERWRIAHRRQLERALERLSI